MNELKKYKVGSYEEEPTMTPEEYLNKITKSTVDDLYDKAIREAKAKEQSSLKKEDFNKKISVFVTTLADCEAELCIYEDLLKNAITYGRKDEVDKLKKEIVNMKRKQTHTANELEVCLSVYETTK